jgi:predicted ribonuclease YlaK
VLDTNVLLHDPACINRFAEHAVCIPVDVLSELDRFKNEMTERGANAREVHRTLIQGHQHAAQGPRRGHRVSGLPQRQGGCTRGVQLEIEALCYIRGRSIPNRFFVLDEAQQLTPLEAKTVVTRMSRGSKLVLVGDPAQIDNPYVDSRSNGLVYTRKRMQGQPFAAHVTLHKGERSEAAGGGFDAGSGSGATGGTAGVHGRAGGSG